MPRKGQFKSLSDRLAPFADRPDECWVLPNKPNDRGYVWICNRGRMVYSHRATYAEYVGPIPDGHEIDHLCRNRACCNPRHLEAVTQAENIRRIPPFDRRPYSIKGKRTACRKGHPYVDGSYRTARRVDRRGNAYTERTCTICERERKAIKYAKLIADGVVRPHSTPTCRQGHFWSAENTGRDKQGFRFCRACRQENSQRQYERAKARRKRAA